MSDTANNKVLDLLKRRTSTGITHWDFPRGFALRSRISDLRKLGNEILTKLERSNNGHGQHARYILIK